MKKQSPLPLSRILPEPADGTNLVMITHKGDKLLVWRDDRTARSRQSLPGANREDRWFDSGEEWHLPVDWDTITSGVRVIYAVQQTPLIGR